MTCSDDGDTGADGWMTALTWVLPFKVDLYLDVKSKTNKKQGGLASR